MIALMDAHALAVLEFAKVRDLLAQDAASALGLEAAAALAPLGDAAAMRAWLRRTTEARRLLDAGEDIPLGGLHDVRAALKRACIGGVLDPLDLRAIADTLRCAANVRRVLHLHEDLPLLRALAAQLVELPHLADEVARCIGEDGEVLDAASSELRRLRLLARALAARVQTSLKRILADLQRDMALRDAVVTVRGGRWCIPVKASHQSRVPGLVHDHSGSGQTVFVEPAEVVKLNNELRDAELAERDEIQRILAGLTALIAADGDLLTSNLNLLATFDDIRMRAHFSRRLAAVAPELVESGGFDLRDARHPLLAGRATRERPVVGNDLRLGDDFRTLLVTGPNTGGKTVALKTLGLLALMAYSGLHVPAEEGSRVALCPDVFADIGDEQSLEQSLSTFGSHLTQIVHVLEAAPRGSLVLLDEIGAGTDPTEGAALAQAILAALHERGCLVMATTHHGSLKAFAYDTPEVENASVEFDARTLSPTYRLLIGIPGASHAFEIAAGLGLSGDVLDVARELLPAAHVDESDIITEMQSTRRRLDSELRAREHEAASASHERRELQAERRRLRELEVQIRADAEREAQAKLAAVQREADGILAELRRSEREGARTEAARQRLKRLRETVTAPPALSPAVPHEPGIDLEPGDRVSLARLGRQGIVLAVESGRVQLQVGPMRLSAEPGEVELVERAAGLPEVGGVKPFTAAAWHVDMEVHLRGMTVDEAMVKLERYLDQALLAGLPEVRIVHGKGTGTLKRVVHEYLRGHPRVSGFSHPPENQGGGGVTVAKLAD
jgi:DNA mismatch repair protein MutS2